MKISAFFLIALAAVVASYQYKVFVGMTYPTKTFSVDGSGDIDTTPDLATFSVTIISEGGTNVSEVQAMNSEKMNTVNGFLKDQGIDKKDMKTTQYNLSPRYSYSLCTAGNCPPPIITGYSLTQTLSIKVRESDKIGNLLSGVVSSGANNVSEVRFVVDDDSTIKDAAREEAITDAKKKALATAKAAGFRLGKLVSLYENASPISASDDMGGYGGATELSSVKAVPPVVEPGTQNTKVQVTLTYEIKN